MERSTHKLKALLTTLVLGASVGSAQADPVAGLAPPGACAEPREVVTGVAPDAPSTEVLAAVGPLQSFFNPNDVAAAPQPASRPVPEAQGARPRGSCDQPGLGCAPGSAPAAGNPPILPAPLPGSPGY